MVSDLRHRQEATGVHSTSQKESTLTKNSIRLWEIGTPANDGKRDELVEEYMILVCKCARGCALLVVVMEEVGNLQGEVLECAKPRTPRDL